MKDKLSKNSHQEAEAIVKKEKKGWTIRVIGVTFKNGVRQEKPLEMFTENEKKEIVARKNKEALEAAGYKPAAKKVAIAMFLLDQVTDCNTQINMGVDK